MAECRNSEPCRNALCVEHNPPTDDNLPERLRQRFGRDVPEGDGWSWEWEVDPLAEEAAKRIDALEHEIMGYQVGEGYEVGYTHGLATAFKKVREVIESGREAPVSDTEVLDTIREILARV